MQNDKVVKHNVKCQGHLKVKVIMLHVCEKVLMYEYKVYQLTNEKVITRKQTFYTNC